MKNNKTCLVLNGGISRAFFQIGVIESLSDFIDFDVIVGSGTGALFATVLAAGLPFDKKISADDFLLPEKEDRWAFFSNKNLLDIFLDNRRLEFSRLSKKLIIIATDLEVNEQVILDQGDVRTAVEASMSFPCFNKPVFREGKFLTDGSIVNSFPTNIACSHGANMTVAIDTLSQHIRDFDEKNVPITPFVEKAAIAFPQMWLLHKKKVPWMEMRMLETSLTSAIDDYSEERKPFLTIKLEEEAPELARTTLIDSFEKIPELIEAGKKTGKKIGSNFSV